MDNAVEFMERLESGVLIPGVDRGIFRTTVKAPVRNQKLSKSKFGQFIGAEFEWDKLMVIDYYGVIKRSSGFYSVVKKFADKGIELRSIVSPVAYFAGIKVEHLSDLAPDLLPDFPTFKRFLVELRDFRGSR